MNAARPPWNFPKDEVLRSFAVAAPILALLLALPVSSARAEALLRLGAEAGASWESLVPGRSMGPVVGVHGKLRLSRRFMLGAGVMHQRQPDRSGDTLVSTLIPLTLNVWVDRAPIAPFVGAGLAAYDIRLEKGDRMQGVGPIVQVGVEVPLGASVAAVGRLGYLGFGGASGSFPVLTNLTMGLSVGI